MGTHPEVAGVHVRKTEDPARLTESDASTDVEFTRPAGGDLQARGKVVEILAANMPRESGSIPSGGDYEYNRCRNIATTLFNDIAQHFGYGGCDRRGGEDQRQNRGLREYDDEYAIGGRRLGERRVQK